MLFFALVLLANSAHAAPHARPAPSPSPSPVISDSMSAKLQALLSNSRSQLGNLEPWQKKIFDDEVLPQYQRFLRDYRAGKGANGQVTAQIDFDSLRKYLRFYAPKSLKRENPLALVQLVSQADCQICKENEPDIRLLVKSRLEHRGFVVEFLKNASADPAALEQIAQAKQASATAVIECKVAPVDDEELAHAEDTEYLLKSTVSIRDVGKSEGQLQILDTGNFSRSMGKLLTDAFTDLGDKAEVADISHSELNQNEIWVQVTGVRGFTQYTTVREQVANALKAIASVQEQKVAQGNATLAVFTEAPIQKVQDLLTGLTIGSAKLKSVSTDADAHLIHLELSSGVSQ